MVLQSFVVAWLDLAKEDAEHGRISKTEFKARNITTSRSSVNFLALKLLSNGFRLFVPYFNSQGRIQKQPQVGAIPFTLETAYNVAICPREG